MLRMSTSGSHGGKRRPSHRRARTAGRPRAAAAEDLDVREQLLAAARELFLRRGFSKTSSREIAGAAGTTAAMIHYYFEDKAGLFDAMVQQAATPVIAELQRVSASGMALDVATLMTTYMRVMAANEWLPVLIVNEVLAAQGQLRQRFIKNFAARLAPMFVEIIRREREAGRVRQDVDPSLATLSVLSLCLFPFISRPITGPVLGLQFDSSGLDRLFAHTTRVYLRGMAVQGDSA